MPITRPAAAIIELADASKKLEDVIERVGASIDDDDEWVALAYLCLDQAGLRPDKSGGAVRVALGEAREGY